jgi:hypothetical protein
MNRILLNTDRTDHVHPYPTLKMNPRLSSPQAITTAIAAMALWFATLPQAYSATLWDGPLTTFTEAAGADTTLPANQDRLTANVWITRGSSQGIYNKETESFYTHNSSPAGTAWAFGTLANFNSLTYTSWEQVFGGSGGGGPASLVGKDLVVHLVADDIYLSVKFVSWGSHGSGFSYQRSTAAVAQPPAITSQPSSRAAVPGSAPLFSVAASTFTGVTNFQWQFNSTNLPGKTTALLTLANVQAASFGPYQVIVNDGTTSLISSVAQLTFAVSPRLSNSVSGTSFRLNYPTEVGPDYVVEFKLNLTNASWTPLATNAGTAATATVTDSLTAAAIRFYRVRLQ